MTQLSSSLRAAWLAALAAVAMPVLAGELTNEPVFESTSSGLLTISSEDKALRVAIVFAKKDEAVVPTLVRFIDTKDNVLKQVRGDLQNGRPVVAELTRRDIGARSDLLVRVEVVHKLPGVRDEPYPILATTQPIAVAGFARLATQWLAGVCAVPEPGPCPPRDQNGTWVTDCDPPIPPELSGL